MAVWKITKDLISSPEDTNQEGKWPNGDTEKHSTQGDPFRLLDDDKNLYFEGVVYLNSDDTGFEPLWDWALPGWGCTEIQYQHPTTGAWETL